MVLGLISLVVCVALVAVGPRALSATDSAEFDSTLHSDNLQEPFIYPVPSALVEPRFNLPPNFSIAALAGEKLPSAQELLALELFVPPTPTPAPRRAVWRAPAHISGYGPRLRGTLVGQTARIDVYVGRNTFDPADIASVAWKLESLLIENEAGLGPTRLDHRISIGFFSKGSSPSKGTRGIAYTDSGVIEVYYNPNEDMHAAFTIAAHEMAHQLQSQRYGTAVQSRSDLILLEGGATWISGARWLDEYGVPSWRGRANQLYNQGIPLRLVGAQAYGSDNAYEMWASFVSYIYRRYGMAIVDELYRSSRGRAQASADYEGVTGKSITELTDDWRKWVIAYVPPTPTPEPTSVPVTPTPLPKPGR
jgi:hypothetical protein